MKFMLFSDLHYYPGAFPVQTDAPLRLIQRKAEEAGCEFIIHAGDLCHNPVAAKEFVSLYHDFHIPSYGVLGNHDTDGLCVEEVLKAYRMPRDYYFFDVSGYRFIVLNTNYYRLGDEYICYSLGNYYAHGDARDWLPPDQLAWLRRTVEESPFPCITISHASFERADGVQNREEVRRVFAEANARRPGSVLMCINGHYHRDNLRVLDGILYFDLNSASYDWLDKPHDCYPKELTEGVKYFNHVVCYEEPLYCIVTVEGSTVEIRGTETRMLLGVTREMTGNDRFDSCGREVTPKIQTARITLG
jgi:predicted phosphodiesterase